MNNAIVVGSLQAIATQNKTSIAETFLSAEVVILVDTSGSMDANDSRGDRSRYQVATEELKALQASLPGKIAVIAFSSDVQFNPAGVAQYMGDGTDLTKALKFVKVADVEGIRFILISDGEPNDQAGALAVARTFKNKIDVIYVGSELSPTGRDFLQRLAAMTGGQAVTAACAVSLAASVERLLLKA